MEKLRIHSLEDGKVIDLHFLPNLEDLRYLDFLVKGSELLMRDGKIVRNLTPYEIVSRAKHDGP